MVPRGRIESRLTTAGRADPRSRAGQAWIFDVRDGEPGSIFLVVGSTSSTWSVDGVSRLVYTHTVIVLDFNVWPAFFQRAGHVVSLGEHGTVWWESLEDRVRLA